jgi:hypothetical protein
MTAAGVAIPRAQGQAIMTTETKASKAKFNPICPTKYQTNAETLAMINTAGTK